MGKLSLVATPIGNLEDITIRAMKTIFSADYILCEDTRRSGLLIQELTKRYFEFFNLNPDWKPKFIAYYDEIEEKKLPEVIGLLMEGHDLALISDAGTPLISDPGFRLVRECVKRNITVESVPGPSALLTALTSSGLPANQFHFFGYPPEKQSARLALFEKLRSLDGTAVFYCAPHKLLTDLEDLKEGCGDIDIVICRELTKVHEQIWRGSVTQALTEFANPKGEFVILLRLEQEPHAQN